MTLQKEKCEFGLTSVKVLGHVVSNEGVKLGPDKVKAMLATMFFSSYYHV